MKIIFLDIDGVLNSDRSIMAGGKRLQEWVCECPYYEKYTICTIDPIAVDLLNNIIHKTGAKIVLSSTHRMHFQGENSLERTKEYLSKLGINHEALIGSTPLTNSCRGQCIQDWLDSQDEEITHYVIIDDSCDMLHEQLYNFVRIDGQYGLSGNDYRECLTILGCPTSSLILC